MKTTTLVVSTLVLAALLATTAVTADDTASKPEKTTPPAIPNTPAAVSDVVYARSFTLNEGYKFEWRKESPLVTEGMILVLKVNPDLVHPRQCLEPVLYVGNQTAERVNLGHLSGHVIAIVPGKFDLKKTPIWFGTPELPERVDAAKVNAERKLADDAKIKPFAAAKIETANQRGGDTIKLINRDDLRRSLAPLVRQYAPEEASLAERLEMIPDPKAKPAAKPESDD